MATSADQDLLVTYADFKSKVEISGDEDRVALMEKVLLMDEEIGTLLKALRSKDEEVKAMRSELQEVKADNEVREAGLREELDDMKNQKTVMSNLLDIVNDHADAVEEELVKRMSIVMDDDVLSVAEAHADADS